MGENIRRPRNPIVRDDDLCWGTPVFEGTRIGVYLLIGELAAGRTIDDFLNAYPHVSRADVVAALELAESLLERNARPLDGGAADDQTEAA